MQKYLTPKLDMPDMANSNLRRKMLIKAVEEKDAGMVIISYHKGAAEPQFIKSMTINVIMYLCV